MSFLRICWRCCARTLLVFHLFCFFALSKVSKVVSSPPRLYAHACRAHKVVNTSNECRVIFHHDLQHTRTKSYLHFLPCRACFWIMVLNLTKKHLPCSELSIYLNIQVCYKYEQNVLQTSLVFLRLWWHFYSVQRVHYDPPVHLFAFRYDTKTKAFHCIPQTASSIKRLLTCAMCCLSSPPGGDLHPDTQPSVSAAAVEIESGCTSKIRNSWLLQ